MPIGVDRETTEGAGWASGRYHQLRPLREGSGHGASDTHPEHGRSLVGLFVKGLDLLLLGLSTSVGLDHHPFGVTVPGQGQCAYPELLLDRL
jgi:hypothetical protein